MTTLLEIKSAIADLSSCDRAVLTAELFAMEEPDAVELEDALDRGLQDVATGRVRPIEDVKKIDSSVDFQVLITESALE